MSKYREELKKAQLLLLKIKRNIKQFQKTKNDNKDTNYKLLDKSIKFQQEVIKTIKERKKERDEKIKEYVFNKDDNNLIDIYKNANGNITIKSMCSEKDYNYSGDIIYFPNEILIELPKTYIQSIITFLQNYLKEEQK